MEQKQQPQQTSLDFGVPFTEYSSKEREALAANVRGKPYSELDPEQRRFYDWMAEMEVRDSQPEYPRKEDKEKRPH